MANTTFIDKQTVIQADWLNDVNSVVYTDLGGPGVIGSSVGASKVGFIQTGTGAVPITVQSNERDTLRAIQFGVTPGAADNTTQMQNAINAAAGRTLVLPAGTINVSALNGISNVRIVGAGRDLTTLRRINSASSGAAILDFTGKANIVLEGITFDGNKTNQTINAYNVSFNTSEAIQILNCGSVNAKGSGGFGISDGTGDTSIKQFVIRGCYIIGNDDAGIYVNKESFISITECMITGNGHEGIIFINYVFPPVAQVQNYVVITNNRVIQNGNSGILFSGTIIGGTPSLPVPGVTIPPQVGVSIANNICLSNGVAGIAYQGAKGQIVGNYCANNGNGTSNSYGILMNGWDCVITGNTLHDNNFFGIDCGGSIGCVTSNNIISYNAQTSGQAGIGINCGASINCVISQNAIESGNANSSAIYASGYEFGTGYWPQKGNGITISNNTISISGSALGIVIDHGHEDVMVLGNRVKGAAFGNDFQLRGGASNTQWLVEDNNQNLSAGSIPQYASASTLVLPDVGSQFIISGTTTINQILTNSGNVFNGVVRFVEITNAGSGYNPASPPGVTFSGGGGSGAAGTALVANDGTVIGINITNGGSGYTSVPSVAFSTGAAAGVARIGCRNFEAKTITLLFLGTAVVNKANNIFLSTASFTPSAGGGSTLTLRGNFGNWYEVARSVN